MAQGGNSDLSFAMTYLGLSAAKQISRELTAGEISDVVSNAIGDIPKPLERLPQTARTKLAQHIDHVHNERVVV